MSPSKQWPAQAAAALDYMRAGCIELAWFAIATVLLIELREELDASASSDASDGGFRQGL